VKDNTDGLGTESERRGSVVHARMRGVAQEANKPQLDAFLVRLRTEGGAAPTEEIRIDIRGMEFMSSACLKCFVNWIIELRSAEPAPYHLVFVPSPTAYWQARSLRALCALASDLVTIDADESAA
jgi:hypothetical protein